MNHVQFVGVIASPIRVDEYPGSEPGELKVKASFLLGVRRPSSNGERRGDLVRVETWGRQARNLVQYNDVRSRIAVSGRLRSEFYNPDGAPRGGQLRSCVVADHIEYLTPKQRVDTAAPAAEDEHLVLKAGRR